MFDSKCVHDGADSDAEQCVCVCMCVFFNCIIQHLHLLSKHPCSLLCVLPCCTAPLCRRCTAHTKLRHRNISYMFLTYLMQLVSLSFSFLTLLPALCSPSCCTMTRNKKTKRAIDLNLFLISMFSSLQLLISCFLHSWLLDHRDHHLQINPFQNLAEH